MTGILHRRSKSAMRALREQMKLLEQQGYSRKRIALEVGATPAQVTRGLGPVRRWRSRRPNTIEEQPKKEDCAACLYRIYDKEDQLLYVGISIQVAERIGQHKGKKDWFLEVASIDVQWFKNEHEARAAELVAIRREKPKYNVAGVPRIALVEGCNYLSV